MCPNVGNEIDFGTFGNCYTAILSVQVFMTSIKVLSTYNNVAMLTGEKH